MVCSYKSESLLQNQLVEMNHCSVFLLLFCADVISITSTAGTNSYGNPLLKSVKTDLKRLLHLHDIHKRQADSNSCNEADCTIGIMLICCFDVMQQNLQRFSKISVELTQWGIYVVTFLMSMLQA